MFLFASFAYSNLISFSWASGLCSYIYVRIDKQRVAILTKYSQTGKHMHMCNCKCKSKFTNVVNTNNHANACILIIALIRMLTLAPHNVGVTGSSPVIASPHALDCPIPPGCADIVSHLHILQSPRFGHYSPGRIVLTPWVNSHENPGVLAPADPAGLVLVA